MFLSAPEYPLKEMYVEDKQSLLGKLSFVEEYNTDPNLAP
jgi:hypothetical protein